MQRRPLRCRLGCHTHGQMISVRHMVRASDGRVGSLVTYRCHRCGERYRRWTDRYVWRLERVQRRGI